MKILLCVATLASFSVAAKATTVFIASNALTTNNSGRPTVDLDPNPGWAPALPGSEWISYGSTGDPSAPGYFSPPDGTVVTFTEQFTLTGLLTGGYLNVLADDTTFVILNGHTLQTADLKKGSKCSAGPIGCLRSTEGVFTFADLAPYLVDGANTLSFGVVQVNGSSFGLDFDGEIVDATATPEPMTFGFVGAGLLIVAAMRRRK